VSKKHGRIYRWYHGRMKSFDSPGVYGVYTEMHWTARRARKIVKFWNAHWPQIILCASGITTALVAIIKF
jgi:hypothetical protein